MSLLSNVSWDSISKAAGIIGTGAAQVSQAANAIKRSKNLPAGTVIQASSNAGGTGSLAILGILALIAVKFIK
jgi:hypothetical protein